MTRLEKEAETLFKFRQADAIRHRDLCRQLADDKDWDGADREKFLREAGAFAS